MNPIRLVAKLTARGVAIDGAGGGGGPVLISATDVGAALGMGRLKPEAILVGRAKFCDDNTAQLELAGWVQTELHRRCLKAGWKTDYCEGLAQLCVLELVQGHRAGPHVSARTGGGGADRQKPVQRRLGQACR